MMSLNEKSRLNGKESTAKIVVLAKDADALSSVLTMLAVLAKMSRGEIVYQVVENDGEAMEMEASADMACTGGEAKEERVPQEAAGLPDALGKPEMRGMLDELVAEGELGDGYQLQGQSWTQRAVIVAYLSGEVGSKCMWSAFAKLWHCDKCVLKTAYDKHCDTDAAKKYYRKLEEILG